ncbi:hypothetical protein [Chroococcidiopsis sp.]|uniref:deoxynucleotide monophosphate kinase family protein n=1 Tax=Chroococcidiopsis sp. TaxID=3088168 RepID=UPI003F376E7E
MRKLIGFSGAIGSGKDEAASYLVSRYDKVYHVKIAHVLQDLVAVIAGFYREDTSHRQLFDDRNWKEHYALMTISDQVWTPRELLKAIGNGMRDAIHPQLWVDVLDDKISTLPNDAIVVISDIRYPNEMDWLLSNRGEALYIRRASAEEAFYQSQAGKEIHASESHLETLRFRSTFCLSNNGTLEQFHDTLSWVMDEIAERDQQVKEIASAWRIANRRE